MKINFFLLLFLTGCTYAQVPATRVRPDSMPSVFPPDLMPNVRSSNSFYRYHTDPRNVIRATLDNMPIKVADSSTQYTILRPYQQYFKPGEPMPFFEPQLRLIPKKS